MLAEAAEKIGNPLREVTEIRQQTDQKLQQVLTPAQWNQFQQLRDETRARRGPQNRER